MVPRRQRPTRPSLHGHHGLGEALLRRLARRPHRATIPAIGVGGDARPHVPDLLLQQLLRLRKRPPTGPTSATSSFGSISMTKSLASRVVRPSLRPINGTSTLHRTVCSRHSWVSAPRDPPAQSAIRASRTCIIHSCPRCARPSSSVAPTRQPTTRTCGSTSTTRTRTTARVTRRTSRSRIGTEEQTSSCCNTTRSAVRNMPHRRAEAMRGSKKPTPTNSGRRSSA